jgi:hypothetical protein
MKRAICSVCKQDHEDIRISSAEGAYGPVDTQTCQQCHEKDIAAAKAENKRFRMRCPLPKPWSKLTTRGIYSEVV